MNDMDIFQVIEKTKELSPKDRKAALAQNADNAGISRIFLYLGAPHKDSRSMLRALCDLCAAEKTRSVVARNVQIHKDRILTSLASPDAKTRKLAAELVGKTDADGFFSELTAALDRENTDFVKTSFILAIGNTHRKKQAALSYLNSYTASASEQKHREEQELALKKAVSALSGEQTASIQPLPKNSILVLDCPSVQTALRDVRALGYSAKEARFPFHTVLVSGVEKYRRIFAARSFYSASILYGEYASLSEVKSALSSRALAVVLHELFGDRLPFRVELKCEKGHEPAEGRSKTAEALARAMDSTENGLVMSPSSYLFEIIVNITAKGILVSIQPSRRLDDRFIYKRESLPASIHPAAAAACISFIREYTYPDADVLDCFCGSGTMLFERARLPYKSLTGSDIAPAAIKAARTNERAAKTGARFFAKNATEPFRESYDEVICNLPFGLRVGSHQKNKELYERFLANLSHILNSRGRAFLFTNDKKLLAELLTDEYTLLAKHVFSCGGLYPAMFAIEKRR